uniref:CAZy families GT51 protein n=1 Tax=uncultured Escherichia sp. TaxID=237777 RepID=A0A060CAY1_9ESCH|nr:CAZy families GT51 protein [uncultured Escherichia sp.]
MGQSKNVVMVRAMRAMGVDYAAEYLQRFGFPAQNIVHTESLALGLSLLYAPAGRSRLFGDGQRRLPGQSFLYQ